MADRIYTSEKADRILSELKLATRWEKSVLAQMAFSLSLASMGSEVPVSTSIGGGEMKRTSFFTKEYEPLVTTLISYVYQQADFEDDELFSPHSIVKNHIDHGAQLLESLFAEAEGKPNVFIQSLLSELTSDQYVTTGDPTLNLLLGQELPDGQNLTIAINNTALHANSHMAIMGKPGVGKTQFLLHLLSDLREQTNFSTNFIFFDFKGDVASNQEFLSATQATPYRLLQGDQSLPINPFLLPSYDEQSCQLSAREKAESFASIDSKLGPVQRGALTEAIKQCYAKRRRATVPYPDFIEVSKQVQKNYELEDKKPDTLVEVLRDLADFNLFWSHESTSQPIDSLSEETMVIDVSQMPVHKQLVAYLVIERLYKEMTILPDSPVVDGRRMLRTVLVIDEAHNYLSQKNPFLQRIIREGRSKGVVVFLSSQSPSDYEQDFFNFRELLEFAFVFATDGATKSSLQRILGCTPGTAAALHSEVSRLPPFHAIGRSNTLDAEYLKFKAAAFFQRHG